MNFNFTYSGTIRKIGQDIKVVSYNSPYDFKQDGQSIEDIKNGIQQTLNLSSLSDGEYNIKLLCRFILQEDGKYIQIFSLKEINEKKGCSSNN